MSNLSNGRKIVLGLGNTLNKDEGLGVHAVALLKTKLENTAPDIEFLDGGTLGLNLLPWIEEASHLLILDSVDSKNIEPGQLIELSRDEIPLYRNIKMSDHQITFQEVLGLAKIRNKLPEHLYLIGAKPIDMSIGVGLSPEIEAKIPEILSLAEQILTRWQLLIHYSPNKVDYYQ